MNLKMPRGSEQLPHPDRGLRMWNAWDEPTIETNFDMGQEQPEWLINAHNTRSGRIFMMGTGPSLIEQLPLLHKLKDEQTWTVNRMAHWGDLPFTPTHHGFAEPGPVLDWGRKVHPMYDYPTAMNRVAVHWFPVTAPGWLWVLKAHDDIQIRWHGYHGLGETLPALPSGWASPLTSSQVAAWLGYTEFYFLGVDTTQEGQAWDKERGRTAQVRSILTILECFDRAKCEIEKAGRKIFDCTPHGRINQEGILEYVPLEEVLEVKL